MKLKLLDSIKQGVYDSVKDSVEVFADNLWFRAKTGIVSKVCTPVLVPMPHDASADFFEKNFEIVNIPLLSEMLGVITSTLQPYDTPSTRQWTAGKVVATNGTVTSSTTKELVEVMALTDQTGVGIQGQDLCITKHKKYGGIVIMPKSAMHTSSDRPYHQDMYFIGLDYRLILADMLEYRKGCITKTDDKVYYGNYRVKEYTGEQFNWKRNTIGDGDVTRGGRVEHTLQTPVSEGLAGIKRKIEVMSEKQEYIGIDKDDILVESVGISGFKGAYYSKEVMAEIDDLRTLLSRSSFYSSKGVAINRGFLIYGPPGTGKSTLSKCTAKEFGIPLNIIYLASQTDDSFIAAWDEACEDETTPKIVLLEDIDNVYNLRTPIHADCKLSFETLLNKISGASSKNNVILMITTNRLDYVDPAIGKECVTETGEVTTSRPGRVDSILFLGPMDRECRASMIADMLEDWPDEQHEVVLRTDGMTCAQVRKTCVDFCTAKFRQELLKKK